MERNGGVIEQMKEQFNGEESKSVGLMSTETINRKSPFCVSHGLDAHCQCVLGGHKEFDWICKGIEMY